MKTLLNKVQQNEFIGYRKTITHKWSCRGMGNSKILSNGNVIGKAGGCGYDRFGAALGNAITELFNKELHQLAKRLCKGRRRNYKQAPAFYGMFYNSITGKAWLDGGCGSSCMVKILNRLGFSLEFVGETNPQGQSGEVFYNLIPITKHDYKYL
tara:strand:+ start:1227 stop:1688 length:462 start_codon:yes stop_codon:yes gene_type:complete